MDGPENLILLLSTDDESATLLDSTRLVLRTITMMMTLLTTYLFNPAFCFSVDERGVLGYDLIRGHQLHKLPGLC